MKEKEHFLTRLIAALLALVLFAGWIPITPASAVSHGLTLDEMMAKFPDGKYWNGGNADGWTEKPCTHHGSCGGYSGSCGCNSFMGQSIQCMGFAEKLGYDATGFNPRVNANGWYTNYNLSALNTLKPGDIVRIDSASGIGHSIYITAVDGDAVTYGDCNSKNRSCNIRWGATTTKTNLRSIFQYVRSAPFELVTGYLGQCEDYLSSGTVAVTADTVLMTYPCSTEIYEKSLEIAGVAAGTVLTVTGVYGNTEGEYWYEVNWQEQTGYFPASQAGEFVCDWGDVTVTGVTAPKHTRQGRSFALYGTVSSDALPLCQVGAYIFQGSAVSETPYMTSEDTAVSSYSYTVRSSTVDNKLTFGKLPAGEFTYLLSAAVTNHYISEGSIISEKRVTRLHQNTFTVSASSISCTHSYSQAVTAENTCGDDGVITFTCTKCGFAYTQTTFATGNHSIGAWEMAQAPTCTENGYEVRSCQGCSLSYVRTLRAEGHSIVTDGAVPATCTTDGLTEGSHCDLCGEVITAQQVIPATNHTEEEVYVAPSCTEQGYTMYICTQCGESYKEDFEAALGHTKETLTAIPATCTQTGLTAGEYCLVCNEIIIAQEVVPMIAHTYQSVVTPPTTTEQGFTTHSCTICGYNYTDSYTDVIEPQEPAENLQIASANLILASDLTVNFFITPEVMLAYSNVYMQFVMNDEVITVTECSQSSNGKYSFAFSGVSPRMLGDEITATVYGNFNETQYSYTMTYSVLQYCQNTLINSNNSNLRRLVVDLAHYGAAHQQYTGYKTNALVDSFLTESQKTEGSSEELKLQSVAAIDYVVCENPQVEFKSASLYLQNAIVLRSTIVCDDIIGTSAVVQVDGQTFIIDSSEFEMVSGFENRFCIYFTELKARQFRTPVYITIYKDGKAISNTLRYSVESYAANKFNSDNDKIAELVRAIMYYGDSAYRYISNK